MIEDVVDSQYAPVTAPPLSCRVELLGAARMLAGVKHIDVCLKREQTLREVIRRLAVQCPSLVGPVLDAAHEALVEGYLFNRNGRDFLTVLDTAVQPGDRLLLLASVAGGGGEP